MGDNNGCGGTVVTAIISTLTFTLVMVFVLFAESWGLPIPGWYKAMFACTFPGGDGPWPTVLRPVICAWGLVAATFISPGILLIGISRLIF